MILPNYVDFNLLGIWKNREHENSQEGKQGSCKIQQF